MVLKTIKSLVSASIFILGVVLPVDAALMNIDLINEGDQLIIWDTDSNLEWLSLDATKNRSIDSLISGTSGPDYIGEYGFHFAGQSELGVLWNNAGVPVYTGGLTSTYTSAITELISFLGTPSPLYSGTTIVGESLTGIYNVNQGGCSDGFHQTATLSILFSGLSSSNAISTSCYNNDLAGTSKGKYLLRTSPIPIPAAIWLFGSGLIALIRLTRRKTHV